MIKDKTIDEWMYRAFRDTNKRKGLGVERFWENMAKMHKEAGIVSDIDTFTGDTFRFILYTSGNNEEKVFEFIRIMGDDE